MAKMKNGQTTLFSEYEGRTMTDTTDIVKSFKLEGEEGDSKAFKKLKKDFNFRLKAIKKLNEQINELPQKFARLNEKYNALVKPTEERLKEAKVEVLHSLDSVCKKKSFSNSQKEEVSFLIREELNFMSENGWEYDEKYNEYFQFDELLEDEGSVEMLQDMMSSMMGVDIDINDVIGDDKLTEEEIARKYKEQFEEKRQQDEPSSRGKSKKQQLEGEVGALNDHFMKTYKQIARKIHPDLEQDEAIREKKQQLMQELTNAKDKEDLFLLLSIKLKVEQLEQNEMAIDESHLKLYSERLLEQKNELEQHIYMLKNHSGWNSWLYQNFYAPHSKAVQRRMSEYIKSLENDIEWTHELNESAKTVKSMKTYLRDNKPDDDLFDMLSNMYFE